jgi:hypothetical protein
VSEPALVQILRPLVRSALWRLPAAARVLYITMLAEADANGYVSIDAVNQCAFLDAEWLPDAGQALISLALIRPIPGGWAIADYPAWRARAGEQVRIAASTARVRRYRARKKLMSGT